MRRLALVICIALLMCACTVMDVPADEFTVPEATVSSPDSFENEDAVTDTPSENTSPTPSISIIMAGDVLLHTRVAESGKKADGSYNYDHMFTYLRDEIEGADIALVNQEVILGGRELGLTGYPSFNGAFEVGDALAGSGFDVILHATNHALDKGKKGLLSCISFWEESYPDIEYLGIAATEKKADEVYVTEINGIKLAVLNYTYGTNGIPLPSDMPYCVNMLTADRLDEIKEDIRIAREQADVVIVCPHWGTEYVLTPDDSQKYWTEVFLDCGVDIVIGTHPHVVEPVEVISDGEHQMLVYYSIGNYINATEQVGSGVADRMLGALADITLTRTQSGVEISDYGVIPIVSHVKSGSGGCTVYKLSQYTEELASQNEIIHSDPAFSLSYMEELAERVFGELYTN